MTQMTTTAEADSILLEARPAARARAAFLEPSRRNAVRVARRFVSFVSPSLLLIFRRRKTWRREREVAKRVQGCR